MIDMESNWSLNNLEIQQLWQQGLDGSNVQIGLLDTGVQPHHALSNKIASFKTINDDDELIESTPEDFNIGHGTEMASILCGESEHYKGIAPKAKLLIIRTLNTHKDILHTLIGLEWLGQQDCRVICLPMGIKRYNPIFNPMLKALEQKGKLVVCPIGNDGVLHYRFPAVSSHVLSVGALDQELQIPNFSGTLWGSNNNLCLKPDIVAPGVKIPTINQYGVNTTSTGTSPACAIVAGIAALLFQAYPNAAVQHLKQAIINTSIPLKETNKKRVRHGAIHPLRALETLPTIDLADDIFKPIFDFEQAYVDSVFKANLFYRQAHETEKGLLWFRRKEDMDEVLADTKEYIDFSIFKKRTFLNTNLVAITSTVKHFKHIIKHPQVVHVSGVFEDKRQAAHSY